MTLSHTIQARPCFYAQNRRLNMSADVILGYILHIINLVVMETSFFVPHDHSSECAERRITTWWKESSIFSRNVRFQFSCVKFWRQFFPLLFSNLYVGCVTMMTLHVIIHLDRSEFRRFGRHHSPTISRIGYCFFP